jgi:hypothetical protein
MVRLSDHEASLPADSPLSFDKVRMRANQKAIGL